jgi:hypothetical protein
MQWDKVADQWIWFAAAGAIAILVVVIATYKFYKSKPNDVVHAQQKGWTPTGRVDFTESIGTFILQAEDTRIIDSIGGVEGREIRWRKATLDEAKTVVVAYHAQRNLAMTANYIVSSSLRRQSGLDNEQQKTQLGKDEIPKEKTQD